MKKILALFLCIVTIASMLYGCKKDNPTEKTSNVKFEYTYDSIFDTKSDSVKNAYKTVCEAISNMDNTVSINTQMFDDVIAMLMTSFPLTYLVHITVNQDNTGLNIEYDYEEKEYKQIVDSFSNNINDILKQCKLNEVSNSEYIFNVYNYIVANANNSQDSSANMVSCINDGTGNSFSYSKLFVFLARQIDVEAYQIICDDTKYSTNSITLIKLDGSYYYFDPLREKVEQTNSIRYFGMNDEYLKQLGISNLYFADQEICQLMSNGTKFDDCKNATSYKFENGVLEVIDENSNSKQITL